MAVGFAVVYKATNIINNKIYIGQTINFNPRKNAHINESFNNKLKRKHTVFHKAIKKYGAENFKWIILFKRNYTKGDKNGIIDITLILNDVEKYFIRFYNSHYINGYGYNMNYGGGSSAGYIMTEEAKLKLIKCNTGRKHSKERNNKISKAKMGHLTSKETREKMRLKKLNIPVKESVKKQISQTIKDKTIYTFVHPIHVEFTGCKCDFYTIYNLHGSTINALTKQKVKSYKGWKLKDSTYEETINTKQLELYTTYLKDKYQYLNILKVDKKNRVVEIECDVCNKNYIIDITLLHTRIRKHIFPCLHCRPYYSMKQPQKINN